MAAEPSPTRQVALGGMLVALILLGLMLAAFWPGLRLVFFTLTSLMVAIAAEEAGLRKALLLLAAAAGLALAWPGLTLAWPFIVFFGPYPLWRLWAQKSISRLGAWLWKLVFAGLVAAGTAYLFLREALQVAVRERGAIVYALLPLFALVLFFIYDHALSVLLRYYRVRLQNQSH